MHDPQSDPAAPPQPETTSAPPPAPPAPAPAPDERKAPGFPGEASPGAQPPHRDDAAELEPVAQSRPFSQFMLEQRRGGLHAELSDALREMVAGVQDHGKPGALTLTITVKPGAKGTRTLVVTDDVKTKIPRGERPAAMFFADDAGNLHKTDPNQPELPLRRVEVGGDDLRRATS